jgi:outer membrane protein OmpA-like peptidoglycan-associated protein
MLSTMSVFGQKIVLDGYVFEDYNRGFLNEVKVTVFDVTGIYIGETLSDMAGHFVYDGVDPGREYMLQYEKKIFKTVRDTFSTVGKKAGEKIFLKKLIQRQPGYLLEVTLAEKRIDKDIAVDGINGCRIEIFNITKNKEELVIDSAKSPVFSITLQQGNQYTFLIRKAGFFAKRLDANVNINGCYLCMDGFGSVNPGVTSNLTSAEDNKLGTLLSNIDLEHIDTNRNIAIQNIYYASNSYDLTFEARKELDKVISLMKNNGSLVIELGSHTDSRGSSELNKVLSQNRAQAAVAYITASGWVDPSRIQAKGYGESRLTNRCEDGTPCSDEEHVRNRRTELRIIGFTIDPHEGLSLAEIVHQEEIMKFALSDESSKQYTSTGSAIAATNPAPTHTKDVAMPKTVPQTAPSVKPNNPAVAAAKQPYTATKPANTQTPINVEPFDVPAKSEEKTASNTDLSKENVKVHLSPVPTDFTGYKVEIFTSKDELPLTDPDLKMLAFDVMSDLQVDKLKNGQFSYMAGSFLNWSETERFLEKVRARYPKAEIVDYFRGKRMGQ